MCANTIPAVASARAEHASRERGAVASLDRDLLGRRDRLGTQRVAPRRTPMPSNATPTRAAGDRDERRRTPTGDRRLLAQLHPLVPGALQELLVLLLAHLLPALLD